MGHMKQPETSTISMAQDVFMHQCFSIPFPPLNCVAIKYLDS